MCPMMVALAEGKYFVSLVRVRPGHNEYLPAHMALSHVGWTGNPSAAWKYLTKSATLGRPYALYASNIACLESLGVLGRSDSPGCSEIHKSQGPVDSRQLVSTALPCLSITMTALRVKVTAQSVSNRGPNPIMVWRNPGMRCPLLRNSDEILGKDKLPVPADCCVCPVAVPTVTLGAARSMLTTGALAKSISRWRRILKCLWHSF